MEEAEGGKRRLEAGESIFSLFLCEFLLVFHCEVKKDELQLVAVELKLIITENAEVFDLKNLIEKSDEYKTDLELVDCAIEHVINKTQVKVLKVKYS